MNETQTQTPTAAPAPKPALPRRVSRRLGRQKRQLKLKTDTAFAKTYFEAKSKRSTEKKSAFRKKKKGKK